MGSTQDSCRAFGVLPSPCDLPALQCTAHSTQQALAAPIAGRITLTSSALNWFAGTGTAPGSR
jgi:hypothetical protein